MQLSIIIPTLNEEKYLKACIQKARRSATPVEIIVVDAGSDDATPKIARRQADRFLSHPELMGIKYASLNAGAKAATGDVLLFLDADTHLPQNYDDLIRQAIRNGQVGGAFRLRFDVSGPLLKTIALLNEVRYRLTRNFFGDQAIFCTKDAFNRVGGFPEKYLMEAAHLCKLLKVEGSLSLINTPVITSSRRFYQGGIGKVFWQDLNIYLRNLSGSTHKDTAFDYWTIHRK